MSQLPIDPLGTVTITAREIYDAVLTLTGRVDALIAQQGEVAEDVRDHETRIRSLEKARWPLPSLAILVSVAGLVIAVLPHLH
jgi:hypothetical protein